MHRPFPGRRLLAKQLASYTVTEGSQVWEHFLPGPPCNLGEPGDQPFSPQWRLRLGLGEERLQELLCDFCCKPQCNWWGEKSPARGLPCCGLLPQSLGFCSALSGGPSSGKSIFCGPKQSRGRPRSLLAPVGEDRGLSPSHCSHQRQAEGDARRRGDYPGGGRRTWMVGSGLGWLNRPNR